MFENYKDLLFNNKIIMRSQLRFKSDHHNMYTEEINKIALNSSNDNKRMQTFDGVTTYPYGTNVFKVCENEMLTKKKETYQLNCITITLKLKLCNVDKFKYVLIKVTNNL